MAISVPKGQWHTGRALESGTVHLVGTNHDLIVSEVSTLLDDPVAYDRMSKAVNPYGDGKACGRIVDALR